MVLHAAYDILNTQNILHKGSVQFATRFFSSDIIKYLSSSVNRKKLPRTKDQDRPIRVCTFKLEFQKNFQNFIILRFRAVAYHDNSKTFAFERQDLQLCLFYTHPSQQVHVLPDLAQILALTALASEEFMAIYFVQRLCSRLKLIELSVERF